ncbi:potassium/proton antiporter [uncultured Fretibacterium sp.]|uniref:potassium/proton antiporter n=1 Tax=uncultured Fretibacterium sp. TaxID=1678694 RepID=UPI002617671A|nr:potassium/proton antiporter [uncultured Fretibacterium sp.]
MLQHLDPFLVTGLLFFLSLIAGTVSERTRIPALLLFLGIGMLAGGDGPGGLPFDDAPFTNWIGTVALAFILFSGGFATRWQDIRPIVVRGVLFSTLGVMLTAVTMACLIALIPGFSFKDGFLLGAIVSSTDAAAVFSILRTQKLGLKGSLKPLLEFESGSNDPMAVFLTLAVLRWIDAPGAPFGDMLLLFLAQMIFGGVMGVLMGRLACFLIQRLRVENEALYPVWGISIVLATFGLAQSVRGNGYLAVYVCGVVMGEGDFLYKYSLERFHDAFAWLMQIAMFLVLGLLVNPGELINGSVVGVGFLVSALLMFVARPLAVLICSIRSDFSLRERLFVSWTGLRGAVPIILATYPMTEGHPHAHYFFNLIFFVVLTSVLLQGKTLAAAARLLKLDTWMRISPAYPLSFDRTPGSAGEETREVHLLPDSCVVGHTVSELNFPDGVTILLVHRGNRFLIPKGGTRLEAGDALLIFGERSALSEVEKLLVRRRDSGDAENEG